MLIQRRDFKLVDLDQVTRVLHAERGEHVHGIRRRAVESGPHSRRGVRYQQARNRAGIIRSGGKRHALRFKPPLAHKVCARAASDGPARQRQFAPKRKRRVGRRAEVHCAAVKRYHGPKTKIDSQRPGSRHDVGQPSRQPDVKLPAYVEIVLRQRNLRVSGDN